MKWQDAPLATDAPAAQPAWMSAPLAEDPAGGGAAFGLFAPGRRKPENNTPNASDAILMGGARGVKDMLDVGAQALASGYDKVAGAGEGDRVRAMNTDGKQAFDAEYGGSTLAKAGRVAGNVAATLPIGGAIGTAVRATSAAPVVQALGNAIASGGLRTGPGLGTAANLATRAAGGAISGGATTAAIDPEHALQGAAFGAALPLGVAGAGKVGNAITSAVRGPVVPDATRAAARAAQEAGYKLPPSMVSPTLANRALEGIAGKQTTAQNLSVANQETTNGLIRKALGLADDAPLTPETLDAVRKEAGKAYAAISDLGPIDARMAKLPADVNVKSFTDPLMQRRTEVDAGELVRAWRQANSDATGYFRAFARDANPETQAKARAASAAAKQIDDFMADRLQRMGQSGMLDELKAARVLIAKTHNAEAALNGATGNINAQKLGAQLDKGKPLSGELRQAAEFAQSFRKSAQMPENMGSLPQTSPLDWHAAGATSLVAGNPLPMLGVAARPMARAAVQSDQVQRRLAPIPSALEATGPRLLTGARRDALVELFARGAPVGVLGR